MSLFTAEGLIQAKRAGADHDLDEASEVIYRAYLRWLSTQEGDVLEAPWKSGLNRDDDGWLLEHEFLHSERAPGITCVSALLGGEMGTPEEPINDSKGCGGIMRVAPIGLAARNAFDLGCRAAAITHGHPSGWLSAGAFAELISRIIRGDTIREGAERALKRCQSVAGSDEVVRSLETALSMAVEGRSSPDAEQVERLGGGWVGEEALAIAVYCALSATNPTEAMVMAVNHGGDSDSTGSITGNLLGAALGTQWIDAELLGSLEGRLVIEQLANVLYTVYVGAGEDIAQS
jgi:ADP-ribosylglycohydrolase